jgi:hypothetical protein
MAVRKAVCISGAECIAITPVLNWMCGVDMVDTYSDQRMAEPGKQARLDVMPNDRIVGGIVAVIRRVAPVERIDLASRYDCQPKLAF